MPILPFDHLLWKCVAFILGACIGSFLNVVIYRIPAGLSVQNPKRSFCPNCKKEIPMWRNIPILSWLLLRGKCADCQQPISPRYLIVEALTGLLFVAVWLTFPPLVSLLLWIFVALLVAISFIDAEHMVIPTLLTWLGTATGLCASFFFPNLPMLADSFPANPQTGLLQSGIGWAVGFGGIWAIIQLGKLAFGRKAMRFEQPVAWSICESATDDEPMIFKLEDDEISWWDIFSRKSDRLIVEASEIHLSGKPVAPGRLIISETSLQLPDGKIHKFEDIKSLAGMATSVVIPREAMGMGDAHLLGMIGAFFGWTGVLFSLFVSSVYAICAAVIGRLGFGKQLPYGPFLALAALTWTLGGWKIWSWYMTFLAR